MIKNILIGALLVLVFILFGYMAQALPLTIPINTNSPYFSEFEHMREIYAGSCKAGVSGSEIEQNMPMLTNDSLDDRFKILYPKVPNFQLHILVFAGFDLGRALNLTTLPGDETDNICTEYSLNFVATLINKATIPAGSDAYPPPSVTTTNLDGSSLFNDWLNRNDGDRINISPKSAYLGACGYMYSVYAKGPVIQLGPLDATLDMMVDMLFNHYNRSDIKMAYPYLVGGAKRGAYLFQTQQNINHCYD